MSIALAVSTFLYINEPNCVMREEPSYKAEIVSSTYYSEEVHQVEESGAWVKIKTSVDSYVGWIPKTVLYRSSEELFTHPDTSYAKVCRMVANVYDRKDTVYGPIAQLPFESRLTVVDASDNRWIKVKTFNGQEGYIQRGELTFDFAVCTKEQMLALSEQFLNLPYIWGGRSSFGYDSSGFTEMLYRQMGIYLPRDSKDQMKYLGFSSIHRDELKPGDLIFWGLAEDKIRHVGMYLGDDQFIHATVRENMPWIHKSKLSDIEWNGSGEGSAGYAFRAFRTLIP